MASRPKPPRRRVPLGRRRGRIGYERRIHVIVWLLSVPLFVLTGVLLAQARAELTTWFVAYVFVLIVWGLALTWILEQLLRPLQTLANVVASLREQDYSFRARGGRRGDALGDLALEINALANELQTERVAALESSALVERILAVMEAPVLAFDQEGLLRLLNPAGARLLQVRSAEQALGKRADALGVEHLLTAPDEQVTTVGMRPTATQWMLRRSSFRGNGAPHTMLLLSDVSVALRQEEQQAWRRLIRVMGHEINNSLTPIKSLAGSLRAMVGQGAVTASFERPLAVIEERADSLNRFLTAYRQLAQLPPPRRRSFSLGGLLRRLATLELRVPVSVEAGQEVDVQADSDQIAQAVINLLRNGAEAALENTQRTAALTLSWRVEPTAVAICVQDSGLGIANLSNLFVPFYTTKEQGTGTGLVLVKQIAEAHQGTVSLANHEDGGAVAELCLPR